MSPSTIRAISLPNSASTSSSVRSRVLDDVVEQSAGDGDRVELQVGEDLGDFDRVRDVRLAGVADLPAMRRLAEPIGAHEQVAIELVVQRQLVLAPAWHHFTHDRRRRHNSPASAKLV